MGFNFNIGWNSNTPFDSNQSESNFFQILQGERATQFKSEKEKLNAILNNPACLKVFALNCDLFSLGIVNQTKDKNIIVEDYLKQQTKKPNQKQNWSQFMWDYCFWNMTGTAYLWKPSGKLFNDKTNLIWLNPANIVWDGTLTDKLRNYILSAVSLKEITKETIRYDLGNGKQQKIPLSEITPIFDLTNGINGNFYKGISRIDALYKIIKNSENSLDAKNINLEFSQKFIVSGQGTDSITETPMLDEEKQSIEQIVMSGKKVHAVKKQLEIKRFVDDIASLKLDECFYNDYFMIGSMFGIPRDVLETNINSKGATYENQEKSIGRHLEYTLKPKAKALNEVFEELFDVTGLETSWQHLSFNQVFEAEKVNVTKTKLESLKMAVDLGMTTQEAHKIIATLNLA